ncbi:MAG: hypothetical protein ACREVH_11185 [Gammaproteobacteria bacterium]
MAGVDPLQAGDPKPWAVREKQTVRNDKRWVARSMDNTAKPMIVGLDGSFSRERHGLILAGTFARYNISISLRLTRRGTLRPVERSNRKVLYVLGLFFASNAE